jgi:uncharacterized protein YjbJ (UPF0337 family)
MDPFHVRLQRVRDGYSTPQARLPAFCLDELQLCRCEQIFLSASLTLVAIAGTSQKREFKAKTEDVMNPGTKDEVAGKIHELKGKIKEKVGQVTNDTDLEDEGTAEKIGGKIQHKIGQIEKVIEKP